MGQVFNAAFGGIKSRLSHGHKPARIYLTVSLNSVLAVEDSAHPYIPTGGERAYKAGRKGQLDRQKEPSNGRFPQICHHDPLAEEEDSSRFVSQL